MKKMYCLAYNKPTETNFGGWRAIAVFDHVPTKEEILKLKNFHKHSKLELDIAEKIAEDGYCALIQRNEADDDSPVEPWVYEYMLCESDENGDLDLNDYLYIGYWQGASEKRIIRLN